MTAIAKNTGIGSRSTFIASVFIPVILIGAMSGWPLSASGQSIEEQRRQAWEELTRKMKEAQDLQELEELQGRLRQGRQEAQAMRERAEQRYQATMEMIEAAFRKSTAGGAANSGAPAPGGAGGGD